MKKTTNTNGKHAEFDASPAVPEASGSCSVSHSRNRQSKALHTVLLVIASAVIYFDLDFRLKHAVLALMFPGGGFVGLGGFWLIGFFINFYAIVASLVTTSYVVITRHMDRLRGEQLARREERNAYLPSLLADMESKQLSLSQADEDREIPEDLLKSLRWQLDLSFLDNDDWSAFDVIEQFQPAALRYQINEGIYTLAFANRFYTPSFRGSYLQEAQEKLIRKYCQEKTTNYEPVLKDNIMLTGFYLLALEFYRAATLDDKFTKDGALVLEIDKTHRYPHSARTLAKALIDNWSRSLYCLYACEPNWIYPFCNLSGINALKCFDTNEGTDNVSGLIDRFRKGYIEEFTDLDGTSVPIKNHLIGFVIPGLIGICNELSCSALTASPMPDVSARAYAFAKKEVLTLDKNGDLTDIDCLKLADKMDPGRYKSSMVTFYAQALCAANSFGDVGVAKAIERLVEEDESLEKIEEGGIITYNNVSVNMRSQLLRAKLMFHNGWKRMIEEPMPDLLKEGPILSNAKYPEVLVAKARTHDGDDLELVLYPGTEKKPVELGLSQLRVSTEYTVNGENRFKADADGKANITEHRCGSRKFDRAQRRGISCSADSCCHLIDRAHVINESTPQLRTVTCPRHFA
ncbi:hypothetical protein ACHAO7_011742 [Fusarium culmorum]